MDCHGCEVLMVGSLFRVNCCAGFNTKKRHRFMVLTCVGLNNVILKLRATGKFTAKGHLLS
jgi:hypothetical protein